MIGEERLKATFICGVGHSGSTLLGMLLGSHSSAFYMGEGAKARYVGDPAKPLHKRVCKICGEACKVWGGFRWDHSFSLYEQVAARAGRRHIVDSTKNRAWIEERDAETRAAGGATSLILLRRDGRAVLNSRMRKYPEKRPEALVRDWIMQTEQSQALYDAFDGPKTVVQYETLATRPASVLKGVCDRIGMAFEGGMLDYHAVEQHPLGGNNGPQYVAAKARFERVEEAFVKLNQRSGDYYRSHAAGISLDRRWKRELSAENEALFNGLAGHLNVPAAGGLEDHGQG